MGGKFGTEGKDLLWRGWEGNEELLSNNFSNPKTFLVWLLFEPLNTELNIQIVLERYELYLI